MNKEQLIEYVIENATTTIMGTGYAMRFAHKIGGVVLLGLGYDAGRLYVLIDGNANWYDFENINGRYADKAEMIQSYLLNGLN